MGWFAGEGGVTGCLAGASIRGRVEEAEGAERGENEGDDVAETPFRPPAAEVFLGGSTSDVREPLRAGTPGDDDAWNAWAP